MVRMQGGCCAYGGQAGGHVHACVARARTRIASIWHFRAGWDDDGGRVVVRAVVLRLRAKERVAMGRAATRRGW